MVPSASDSMAEQIKPPVHFILVLRLAHQAIGRSIDEFDSETRDQFRKAFLLNSPTQPVVRNFLWFHRLCL
jgi:hypothetical protein